VNFLKVLILFAHPEPKSLNGALKDVAAQTLKDNRNHLKVSDLYGLGFKTTLNREDLF
jgi:NAD(P)H dehydrogenase (quinone)